MLFPFRYLRWLISSVRRARDDRLSTSFCAQSDLPAPPDPPRPSGSASPATALERSRARGEVRCDANDPRVGGILHLRPTAGAGGDAAGSQGAGRQASTVGKAGRGVGAVLHNRDRPPACACDASCSCQPARCSRSASPAQGCFGWLAGSASRLTLCRSAVQPLTL